MTNVIRVPGMSLQIDVITKYHEDMQEAQKKSKLGYIAVVDVPLLPFGKHINQDTMAVLHAYRNMALVWSHAGGCIPDPTQYLELLQMMHCNNIKFRRDTGLARDSSYVEKTDIVDYISKREANS